MFHLILTSSFLYQKFKEKIFFFREQKVFIFHTLLFDICTRELNFSRPTLYVAFILSTLFLSKLWCILSNNRSRKLIFKIFLPQIKIGLKFSRFHYKFTLVKTTSTRSPSFPPEIVLVQSTIYRGWLLWC